MTQKFIEIVLSKLMNERDMLMIDLDHISNKESKTDEKVAGFINILEQLTDKNSQIETLTGMIPEGVFNTTP